MPTTYTFPKQCVWCSMTGLRSETFEVWFVGLPEDCLTIQAHHQGSCYVLFFFFNGKIRLALKFGIQKIRDTCTHINIEYLEGFTER